MDPSQNSPVSECWQTPPPTPALIGTPAFVGHRLAGRFVSPLAGPEWRHSTPFQREKSYYATPCCKTPSLSGPYEYAIVHSLLNEMLSKLDESVDLLCYSNENIGEAPSPVCPRRISSNRLAQLILSYSEEQRDAVSRAASACAHPLERHVLHTQTGQLRVLDELNGGQLKNDRMPDKSDSTADSNDLSESSILNSSLFENPSFLQQTTVDAIESKSSHKWFASGFVLERQLSLDRSSIGTGPGQHKFEQSDEQTSKNSTKTDEPNSFVVRIEQSCCDDASQNLETKEEPSISSGQDAVNEEFEMDIVTKEEEQIQAIHCDDDEMGDGCQKNACSGDVSNAQQKTQRLETTLSVRGGGSRRKVATRKRRLSITPGKMRTRSSNAIGKPTAAASKPVKKVTQGRRQKLGKARPAAAKRLAKSGGSKLSAKSNKRSKTVKEEPSEAKPKKTSKGRPPKVTTAPVRVTRRGLRSSTKEQNVVKK